MTLKVYIQNIVIVLIKNEWPNFLKKFYFEIIFHVLKIFGTNPYLKLYKFDSKFIKGLLLNKYLNNELKLFLETVNPFFEKN